MSVSAAYIETTCQQFHSTTCGLDTLAKNARYSTTKKQKGVNHVNCNVYRPWHFLRSLHAHD